MLEAGLEQFLEFGYDETPMSRIAEVARVTKATLYKRFPGKRDLFIAIIEEAAAGRLSTDMPIPLRLSDLRSELVSYANRVLQVSLRDRDLTLNRLIFSEARRFAEIRCFIEARTLVEIGKISHLILHASTSRLLEM